MLAQGRDDALLRFGIGSEYFKRREYIQAIDHFSKAIEHDPEYSAAWKFLCKALQGVGDKNAAIEACEKGIAIAKNGGDAQAVKEMQVLLKRAKSK